MSEYQYYEFQAVDRPLTKAQMAELRARSTRANITPTRFQNVYHWGDLKGNPLDWTERYFDAFVYVANWGTNQFMVKLPRRLLDAEAAWRYAMEEALDLHTRGDAVILEFVSHDDQGGYWIEDEEAEGWMPALLPLRAELAGGDLRALYLGWLAGVAPGASHGEDDFDDNYDDYDDEEDDKPDDEALEPPVPAGLNQLSAALDALTDFLRIDRDLLAVAAQSSPALPDAPADGDLQRWIAALPAAEKDALLIQLASAPAPAHAELLRRFHRETTPYPHATPGRRSIGAMRAAAQELGDKRRREEAERQAAERERQARAAAIARASYLDSLTGREEELWEQVEALIETKQPKQYDRALMLLTDSHDLCARQDRDAAFADRLDALRERYAKRPALLSRLDGAELNA
jgi:hypothetical protein